MKKREDKYDLYYTSTGNIWKPMTIGEQLIGTIISHRIVEGKNGGFPICEMAKETGEFVQIRTDLKGLQALQTIPAGVKIRITYVGESERKYFGKHMKFFDIETKGKFDVIEPIRIPPLKRKRR